ALGHGIQLGLLRPMLDSRSAGIAEFPSSQHGRSNLTEYCQKRRATDRELLFIIILGLPPEQFVMTRMAGHNKYIRRAIISGYHGNKQRQNPV
ncbi:hypothetical protein, partial [Haloferax volcanii]|uniref:hypothetical protein n=1 Tax=Haloferax volcanii TaxID=2246 RepID=UPI0019D3321A